MLIVAQPTWGLDVGAAAQIRGELTALAARGVAVLIVSEDLDELFEIATALVVMARGRLSPRIPVREARIAADRPVDERRLSRARASAPAETAPALGDIAGAGSEVGARG